MIIYEKSMWQVQIETENKHRTLLFIAYIEVTFLKLQHKIQLTDTSVIIFKTENLLKTNPCRFGFVYTSTVPELRSR